MLDKKMSGKKMMRRVATQRLHLFANHFLANSIGDAGLTVWKSSPPAKIFKLFSRREEERQNHVLQNDEGGCGDFVSGRFTLVGTWACLILYS